MATRRGRTHEDHGGALRHHEGQHHVAHLALPQSIDASIGSLSLLPAVPAEVVVGAVPILLAVCLVVLVVVGHQVMQGKAIVSYDEIDALVRLPASHTVLQQLCMLEGPQCPAGLGDAASISRLLIVFQLN